MKYALGNMLNGAGGLNPDGLSLDLQFATDKTLTARKGPNPGFTRATTGTFIGSDGLIQTASINVARFDHDPNTLVCKGLLIEEQRTNDIRTSASPATQTRTVIAVPYTLSFYGTGTIVLSGVHVATVTGSGAYPARTTLTFTPTAGSLILTITGSVTNAQLEAGSFATSWIFTPAFSGATRSADVCSIIGGDFTSIWSGVDATMFFRGSRIANQAGQTNWSVSSGSIATSIASDRGASSERIVANAIGIMNVTAFATLAEYKIATALKTGDYAASYNGASAVTSSSAFVLTLNKMTIGSAYASNNFLNGWVHSMKFYKKRLPNAKLQSLTA